MRRTALLALVALATFTTLAPQARADRVITKDQRVLTCKKARAENGGWKLVFDHGEVLVPDKSHLLSVEVEGDMSDYVPANDDEKKKLADGYVRYEGKWLSKPAYEALLKQNYEKSKKRLEDVAAHAKFDSGWTKDTEHFSFKTNTSPELLQYYCELLEAYYDLQDQRIGINPTLSMKRTKMRVNIYKNYPEFRKEAPYGSGEVPFGVIGFFSPMDKSLNFYHDYAEPSRSTWVALHECTHLLTYLIDQSYIAQIWLNEGVADYFGSSKVERDKKGKIKITPGEIQTDRMLTVQDAIRFGATSTGGGGAAGESGKGKSSVIGRPFIKLKDLLFVPREKFQGFEYAHAWSFVYFLNNYENGKYQKAFNQFFKGLYTLEKGIPFESVPYGNMAGNGKRVKPEDIRDYLMKKIGVKDIEALEADWKHFVETIPIEGPHARLKRGLMAVRGFEFEDALPDLNAAIEGGTTDPRAWARAQVHAVQRDWKAAQDDIKLAVDKDPMNAAYRYQYSRFLEKQLTLRSGDIEDASMSMKSNARFSDPLAKTQAGLATELDPENVEFQEWLAKFE